MLFDVFVSYSHKDKAVADAVVSSLENNNIRCWYAPRDINPSDDWGEAISKAIEKSKVFLLIFSGSANRSRHVLDELILAIDEEVTVLPFRIENLEPKGAMRLHLSSRHWLNAYDPSWEKYIQQLVQTICLNLNIPYPDVLPEEPLADLPLPQKKKNKGIKILAGIGIAAVLIAAAWLGGTKLLNVNFGAPETPTLALVFATNIPDREETQASSTPDQEGTQVSTHLGKWNEGCRIAYGSMLDDYIFTWLMAPDGSSQTPLTDNTADDNFPTWSYNGEKIAFLSDPGRSNSSFPEIWVIDKTGKNLAQVSKDTNMSDYYHPFEWSPVEETIAYVSNANGNEDIFISDMKESRALTEDPGSDTDLAWSPNGEQIAFVTERNGNQDIYLINIESGELTRLTHDSAQDTDPDWSADGERIAFSSNRSGSYQVYLMNADGSNVRQLTDEGNNRHPAWSGDGEKLAFYSDKDVNYDLYVINADGSQITRLFDSMGDSFLFTRFNDIYFSWAPDGTEIIFSYEGGIYLTEPDGDNFRKLEDVVGWFPVWSPACYRKE